METRVYVGEGRLLSALIRDRKTGMVKVVRATADKKEFRAKVREAKSELEAARPVQLTL